MTDGIYIEDVIVIHDAAITEFGGETGLRDRGLLEATIAAPFQTFGGEELFPSILEKASRLAYGIIKTTRLLTEIKERQHL